MTEDSREPGPEIVSLGEGAANAHMDQTKSEIMEILKKKDCEDFIVSALHNNRENVYHNVFIKHNDEIAPLLCYSAIKAIRGLALVIGGDTDDALEKIREVILENDSMAEEEE